MKSRRSVSDFFRDSQDKLERRPSPQAWQRLERRLDQRSVHRRRTLPRTFYMAAALLLLIGFVFVISYSLPKQEAGQDVFATATLQIEEDFNDLEEVKTEAEGVRKAIVYSNQIHDRSQNIKVSEGEETQKLVPRTLEGEMDSNTNDVESD